MDVGGMTSLTPPSDTTCARHGVAEPTRQELRPRTAAAPFRGGGVRQQSQCLESTGEHCLRESVAQFTFAATNVSSKTRQSTLPFEKQESVCQETRPSGQDVYQRMHKAKPTVISPCAKANRVPVAAATVAWLVPGYPFALFQRYFLFQKEAYLIHLYNVFTGLSIAYFNFGTQFFHSLICVLIQFLILRLMGRTITAVFTTFFFQMTYLMAGYYFTATEHYDIKWTMPHCVLTLKLIGLAIDYYDGGKDPEFLTPEQRRFAVRGVPTLLEVSGFSYFYGAFMVGPQFSMTDYQKLAKGEMTDVPGQRPNSFVPALKRLSLGLVFLVTYTLSSLYVFDEYLISNDYMEKPFWFRCGYILIWGKIILYKYVTCWLVTEGVCILVGLGYNGKDQNGKPLWNACANMKVWLYETTPLFTGTIASFNINTNAWVARYIFKRLKFLGNKLLSQALALFFLAIWHGLHSGYLVCFQMELLIVIVERQVINLVRDSPALSTLASITLLRPIFYVLQQTNHWMFMGYSLVPFCLFTWDKWMKVYRSIYFFGHVLFFTLLLVLPYIRRLIVPRKEKLKRAE
ncbi:Lysophospholipid acyltransferase 5 [Willisornis vidua]|uniref:Lysophospholipid acyltransferase 5 n=1 Tax=Willisornis vidua TaxID=1566151 RepID=A0ABQ9D7R7_9PASS|nr:Lysophospholipid acyltransferase 5 [Willisornis vidua]